LAKTPVVEKSPYTILVHLIIGNYGQQNYPLVMTVISLDKQKNTT